MPPRSEPWRKPAGSAGMSGVPNYLLWAIVCSIFFFTPAGVAGIVSSVLARRRASAGDVDGALRASRVAKTFCWISLILGLVAYLLVAARVIQLPGAKT